MVFHPIAEQRTDARHRMINVQSVQPSVVILLDTTKAMRLPVEPWKFCIAIPILVIGHAHCHIIRAEFIEQVCDVHFFMRFFFLILIREEVY